MNCFFSSCSVSWYITGHCTVSFLFLLSGLILSQHDLSCFANLQVRGDLKEVLKDLLKLGREQKRCGLDKPDEETSARIRDLVQAGEAKRDIEIERYILRETEVWIKKEGERCSDTDRDGGTERE